MIELDGPDLFQLAQERPDQPTHTLKVAVLERPVEASEVDAWSLRTLAQLAPLRWMLAGPRWARPVLVDGDPDVSAHVVHHPLAAPGGEHELTNELSRLCGEPLDRTGPLWRLTHLTGFAGGGDVLAFQLHHAIADGAASVALWEALADEAPRPRDVPETGAHAPGPTRALRAGAKDLVRLPGRVGRLLASGRRTEDGAAAPFTGPMTAFNGRPERARSCSFVALPLADLQAVRTAAGASLTQVFLTLAGGAVRRHLEAGGEPLDAGLTATVPTALSERRHRFGNAVTTLNVALRSEIDAPLARLDAVGASLAATRRAIDADPRVLPDLQRYPRLYGGLVSAMDVAARRKGRPSYNLIVSSVRGPTPFSLMGVPVAELRSVGPLSGHIGLNLTGWSYGDDFTVGIHAYASAGDGLDALGDLLLDELERLQRDVTS